MLQKVGMIGRLREDKVSAYNPRISRIEKNTIKVTISVVLLR